METKFAVPVRKGSHFHLGLIDVYISDTMIDQRFSALCAQEELSQTAQSTLDFPIARGLGTPSDSLSRFKEANSLEEMLVEVCVGC